MKLYTTTTSERASKGQGGNEFINVFINDDNGCMLVDLKLKIDNDTIGEIYNIKLEFAEHIYVNGHHWLDSEIKPYKPTTKDKKQKTIELCNSCDDFGRGEELDPDCPICN